MPRRSPTISSRTSSADLATALRRTLERLVETEIDKHSRNAPLAQELRRLGRAVSRIERRLDALASRVDASRMDRRGAAGGRGRPGRPPTHTSCTLKGCRGAHYARGLCSKHYQQRRRSQADTIPLASRHRRASH